MASGTAGIADVDGCCVVTVSLCTHHMPSDACHNLQCQHVCPLFCSTPCGKLDLVGLLIMLDRLPDCLHVSCPYLQAHGSPGSSDDT